MYWRWEFWRRLSVIQRWCKNWRTATTITDALVAKFCQHHWAKSIHHMHIAIIHSITVSHTHTQLTFFVCLFWTKTCTYLLFSISENVDMGGIVCVCMIAISLMLIYGAAKYKPSHLLPFFCLQLFDFAITTWVNATFFYYLTNSKAIDNVCVRIRSQVNSSRLFMLFEIDSSHNWRKSSIAMAWWITENESTAIERCRFVGVFNRCYAESVCHRYRLAML